MRRLLGQGRNALPLEKVRRTFPAALDLVFGAMNFSRKKLIFGGVGLVLVAALVGVGTIAYIRATLPSLITLDDYKPLLVTKVYDRNGKSIGEFFRERRVLLPYDQMPKDLVNAFLAAEDDSFFQHGGINYLAIIRAQLANLRAGATVQGGSTITQQVAKTLILQDSSKNILRKVKDVLLALQMEEHLSKEDILYLYLNQIYFGQGAYGISMAAETYFRKPVKDLKLEEIAILAALPKAPSAFSPVTNPVRAKERQIYVLNRMADVGFISKDVAESTGKLPVTVYLRENYQTYAPFFLETVRLLLLPILGEDTLLDKGLKIYTSLDLEKQQAAQEALNQGLRELDKRQGFRGPLRNTVDPLEVGEFLLKTRNKMIADSSPERIIQVDGKFKDYGPLNFEYDVKKLGLPKYMKPGTTTEAIVSKVDDEMGLVTVKVGEVEGLIDIETMQWARVPDANKRYDLDVIKKPSQALKMGDIVLVRIEGANFFSSRIQKMVADSKKSKKPMETPDFSKFIAVELDQEPISEGSLLSIDQQTQDVLAMIGGYSFDKSQFNRALQAARQTGSSYKSIVYASALDRGYTPSTPIMDAPIVFDNSQDGVDETEGQDGKDAKSLKAKAKKDQKGKDDEENKVWKPANHSKSFGGDIIFRNALVKSLNVPAVKILEDIGIEWATDYSRRLGIYSPLNPDFTLALGSSSVTLYEMTKVFSEFGRMGKRTRPLIIHKVEDSTGAKILDTVGLDARFAKEISDADGAMEERRKNYLESLANKPPETPEDENAPVPLKNKKPNADENFFFQDPDQLIKPTTAYLITSLLKGVVEDRGGTGGAARSLGREVAAKTGTTNGYYDAWFVGFTAQIATGVWVGFDQERSLGKGEVGGRAALPIWLEYMKSAHEGLPQMTFSVPQGIVFANIDGDTGELASSTSKNIVRQAYLEGTEPTSSRTNKEEETDFYKQDMSE
jgi:penicillin-binding protein 1A